MSAERRVDWLEVMRVTNAWYAFKPREQAEALEWAAEKVDATGVIRERLSDGSIGRKWRVTVQRGVRMLDERRVDLLEAA